MRPVQPSMSPPSRPHTHWLVWTGMALSVLSLLSALLAGLGLILGYLNLAAYHQPHASAELWMTYVFFVLPSFVAMPLGVFGLTSLATGFLLGHRHSRHHPA